MKPGANGALGAADGSPSGPFSLGQIAAIIGGEVAGDPAWTVSAAAPFETATAREISFAAAGQYLKRLAECRAGALIVPRDTEAPGRHLIRVDNPAAAFARVLALLHPPSRPAPGIAPTAVIGAGFACGAGSSVGAQVVIGDGVTLGARVVLHPHVVLGDGVCIGDDSQIFANVTILAGCRIGRRVKIQSGSVIGSDGFGYAREGDRYLKIVHRGIVQIDDDVEIGAGNTIDRATFGRTWIQAGVRTDNLVQIAHNVTVGENTVIVAQVGISGSVTIGRQVILAGQAGIAGHLSIGDRATVGPQAGVARSVTAGAVVSGSPEMPHRQWLRVQRITGQLPDLARRIRELEARLAAVEARPPAPSSATDE